MVIFPKAKINLGLRITGKRNDGYHNIESIFYPVDLCDALEFVVSTGNEDTLVVTGIETGSLPEDNLVMKAVRLLRGDYSFPGIKIHLHKAIPAGAGLGGGSSDAAAVICAINKYFRLNISENKLHDLALKVGSDCPFFVKCGPALVKGRGEELLQLDPFLKGYYILMVNPSIHISTHEAYRNCHPGQPPESLSKLVHLPVNDWKNVIINDFEEYVFEKHPFINELKKTLYEAGALYSSMSGSGSTVYGIFRSKSTIPGNTGKYVIFEGWL